MSNVFGYFVNNCHWLVKPASSVISWSCLSLSISLSNEVLPNSWR